MADEFGSDNPYLRFLRPPGAGPSTLAQDAAAESTSTNPYLRLRAMSRAAAPVPDAGAPSSAGGIGSYVSAALAPQDVAFRYGARHLFGIPVSDEATAASALTSGLGLQQGGEGYGKRVLRSGIEFGADVGLNPLTYALPGGGAVARGATAKAALEAGSRLAPEALGALAPEAATAAARLVRQGAIARRVSQAAGVGFTGMMGAGLAQKVPQIAQDIGAHGFTPEVAGELTSAGLEAAGAGLGAAHLYHGLKTPYGIPEPAPTVNVPLEGPVQEGAIPRVTTISSLGEAARVNQFYREQGTPESDPAGTQYSPSWVDEPIPVPGFESPIPRGRGLSPEQRAVEDRATAQVTQDPAGMVAAYRQANTKNGTLIINTDNARELFPDYNENRALHSPAVHEPASWLVRRAWEQALAEPTPEGKQPIVVFTSGASGVGKSTGLKLLKEAEDAHIIFDTNMSTLDSSIEKIEQARAAGNFVVVQATHRDPVEAWFDGVVHRAMKPDDGRMVPLDTHMATTSAPEVFKALRDRYANDPDVGFRLADNSRGKNNAKLVDVRAFDGLQYDQEKIRGQIEDETRRRVEAGELPPRILQGAGIQFPGVDGSVQSGVRGQPESERVEGQPGAAAPAAPVPAEGIEPQPPEPVRVLSQHTPEQAREILAMQERADAAAAQAAGGGNAVPESAAAAPHYAVAPKQPAEPPSKLGFYSQLSRVVASLPQPMKGSDMARYLADPKRGVKAEEMKWTGLDDWLKERAGAKVTPQEVQEFIAQNKVEVKEVTKGRKTAQPLEQMTSAQIADIIRANDGNAETDLLNREQLLEMAHSMDLSRGDVEELSGATKFSQYQTPGGSNYREVLLTLPQKHGPSGKWSIKRETDPQMGTGGIWVARDANNVEIARGAARDEVTREALRVEAGSKAFTGGHFDEPNVLAHVRLNDRTDADGKRVLFVEEVQSDWAQKGRREGFRNDPKRITDLQSQYDGITEAMLAAKSDPREQVRLAGDLANIEAALREAKSSGIPQAPFVTNTSDWSVLAMKRIMRMAAEEGYDRVAWTTGEQQAARYDLSKHVERVLARNNSDGSFVISYIKKGGGPDSWDVIPGSFSAEELAAHVGKDLADKIIADAGKVRPGAPLEYSGLDLKVGGEGMNVFYDQILPQVAEKVGKKWGVKVGQTQIETPLPPMQRSVGGPRTNSLSENVAVHSIDITPEMRASVAGEGFPQFKVGERGAEERAPVKPVALADANRALPGFEFADRGDGVLVAPLAEGGEIRVHPGADVEIPDRHALKESAEAGGVPVDRAAVVGSYRRLGKDSIISVTDGESTLDHEAWHFVRDRALNDKEKVAAAKRYGNEEAEAYAYADWRKTRKAPNSWFSKVYAYAQRLIHYFKPTWESTAEEVASGRVGERIAGKVRGREAPFAPAPPADFNRAKATSSRPGFLSEYSDHDLAGKQTFLSPDKRTGYLLDENGDFGNLFNTGPKGAGREAILHAIEKGDAQTLDAFDGYLPDLYAQYGFKPTGAMKWNDEYAPKGWNYARDGRPDVVFMSYQGGDRGTIRDRVGTFEPYTHPGNYYDSFDQAKADSRAAALAGEQGQGARPGLGGQEPADAGKPVGVHRQPVGALDVLAAAQRGQPSLPRYATAPAEPPQPEGVPRGTLTDRLKEAALAEGGRTSAKPGAGGEREGPINLDRINTTDDVKQMMDRLTTAALPDIRRGKGKMTLAEIKAAGEEILGKGQFDERKLERMQRENSALNSAQMTAARMLHQSAIDRVMEAGKAHAEALKDPHADSTRTEDALNATVLKWKGVGLAALGRQAEAARTLAAHNIFVEGLSPEQRMLHDMMKQNGMAMSDAEVKELVLAAASGDRKAVENAARKALAPSWFDKFYEVYVNGLISGPATHIANNASNTSMQAAGVVKRLLSAGIEQVRAKIQGQTPERFVDDTYAHLRGLKRGLASAFEPDSPYSFPTAMKGGASGGKLEINRLGAIPGKLGEVVRLPGTALEAEDKVFKSASFFSEAYVRAGRKARGEAVNRGMADTTAEEYISKRREEIVDAIDKSYRESTKAGKSYSGPFKDIFEPAEKAARYDTFQKEAGPILAAVMRLREADPTGIFKIVMPFMRTPSNIAKVTIEHTPLKLFEIAKKIRSGELRGGQISDELAKPLFGALLAIPVVYAAKEGMLTGSGPTDPKERELWRATGAQPNSVVMPINGKLTYISYGRLEPISTLMTMAVDFNEAIDAKSRGTAADKIVGTVLNSLNDKTFLAGLSDLVLAWHDPKRYASTLVKDTAGNLVPASSLMRATVHAIDPVTRERVGVLDAMMANIPGLSQTLAAKPTGTGVPIERQHPIISSLTPFSTTEERPENRIERLMLDLDFHPSTPQRILTIPGSHGRKVELTREEFAAFEKADRETTTKLQGLVDRLKHLPSEEQRAYLERAYSNAARGVRERLYGTSSFRERARTALDAAKQERLQSAGAP